MTNALASIAYDIGQELDAGNTEAAIAKLELLRTEIERANCKHDGLGVLTTVRYDPKGINAKRPPIQTFGFKCSQCGRYIVGEDNVHATPEP